MKCRKKESKNFIVFINVNTEKVPGRKGVRKDLLYSRDFAHFSDESGSLNLSLPNRNAPLLLHNSHSSTHTDDLVHFGLE